MVENNKVIYQMQKLIQKRTNIPSILNQERIEEDEDISVHKYNIVAKFKNKKAYCKIQGMASFSFPAMSFELAYQTNEETFSMGNFLTNPTNSYLLAWAGMTGQTMSEDMNYKKNAKSFRYEDCDKAFIMFIRKVALKQKLRYELRKYTDESLTTLTSQMIEIVNNTLKQEKKPKHIYFDIKRKKLGISRYSLTKTMKESGFKFVASLDDSPRISLVISRDTLNQIADKKWIFLDDNIHYLSPSLPSQFKQTVLIQDIERDTNRLYFKECSPREYLEYHLHLREKTGEYFNSDSELRNCLEMYNVETKKKKREELVGNILELQQNPIKLMYELGIGIRKKEYFTLGISEREYGKIREFGKLAGTYGIDGFKGPYNLYEYDFVDYLKWRNGNKSAAEVVILK